MKKRRKPKADPKKKEELQIIFSNRSCLITTFFILSYLFGYFVYYLFFTTYSTFLLCSAQTRMQVGFYSYLDNLKNIFKVS